MIVNETISQHRSSSAPGPDTQDSKPEAAAQDLSQTPAVSNDDEGWACRATGECELFPSMDISQIKVIRLDSDFREFQIIQPRAANKPDHVVAWCEAKGHGIVVWSTFAAKTRRPSTTAPPTTKTKLRFILAAKANINTSVRKLIFRNMEKQCLNPSGRLQALGFTNYEEVSSECKEAEWYVFNSRKDYARLSAFAPYMRSERSYDQCCLDY